jgi:hypothetical protein
MSDTITVNTTSTSIDITVVEAGALWGSINGTLSAQTDLINYIDSLDIVSPFVFTENDTSINTLYGSNTISASGSNIFGGCYNTVSGYNSTVLGGGYNNICPNFGYNTIVGGLNNTTCSGCNSFIGSGYYNTICGNVAFIGSGVGNTASGNYTGILGGANNNTNNQTNTFILGSNITAISANYTYVNNLSTSGSICAGTFYGDGSHLIGASLPGQAGINSLVQNTSGNWNTAYSISTAYSSVSSTFATNTTVNTLTGLLTLLTTTRTLTGLLVKTTDLNTVSATLLTRTDANTLSSLLLNTTIYQNASGNWQNAYTNISNLSSTYAAVTAINGTANQISVNNTGNVYSLSLPNTINIPGNINVPGTLNVTGSANFYNTQYFAVSNNLIYFGEGNTANLLDLGIVTHFIGTLNSGLTSYQHTGFVRHNSQGSPGVWTLFSGLTSEPESTPSGINWNDPYFQLDTLSANFVGNLTGGKIYTTGGNSDQWNTAYNIATTYQGASSTFATNTTVNTLTSLLTLTTTTNTLTSLLVKTTDLNTLSATLLTRTDANTLSSLLTPLTVTNTLTSQLVKTTDLNTLSGTLLTRTDANTLSSLLVTNTNFNNLSGNWQSTYATVGTLSANWQSAYSRVSANNLYLNVNTTSLSALNAYLVVQTISAASYIGVPSSGGGSVTGAYLPLSGGQLTGFVTSTSSVSAQGTITATNLATNSQVQFLTGSSFVKVYQFYNSTTNSIDTVFN